MTRPASRPASHTDRCGDELRARLRGTLARSGRRGDRKWNGVVGLLAPLFVHLREHDGTALEGLRGLGVREVGGLEELVELRADELALLHERAGDRVDGVLLLTDEPLRLLEELVEQPVRDAQDRAGRGHRTHRRYGHERRAHAELTYVLHGEERGGLEVRAGTGHPRVKDDLFDRARPERDHDVRLDLLGVPRVALLT